MLNYKGLKKFIKKESPTLTEFTVTLSKECQSVESTFIRFFNLYSSHATRGQLHHLSFSAFELLFYARINAVALRKVLKKFDKKMALEKKKKGIVDEPELLTKDDRADSWPLAPIFPASADSDVNDSDSDKENDDDDSDELPSPPSSNAAAVPPPPAPGLPATASSRRTLQELRNKFKFASAGNYYVQELAALAALERMGKTVPWVKTAGGAASACCGPSATTNATLPPVPPELKALMSGPANDHGLINEIIDKHPELSVHPEMSCAICIAPFYNPVALTCGHAFCKPCIAGLFGLTAVQARTALSKGGASELDPVSCPRCRMEVRVDKPMPLLHALCKEKYAEEYKERREELRQAASAEYKEAIRAQQSGSLWNSLLKMVTG